MNPWVLLGAAAAIAAGAAYTYHLGYERALDKAQADQLAAVQRAVDQYRQREAQDREIEAAWVEQLQERRIVYRTIDREVTRYVEDRGTDPECFDTDGLRIVRAAARGDAPAPPARGADGRVPDGAAGTRRGP